MLTTSAYLKWLIGLSAAAIVLLFFVPPTGQALQAGVSMFLPQKDSKWDIDETEMASKLAPSHPNDFDVQLLAAKPNGFASLFINLVPDKKQIEKYYLSEISAVDRLCDKFPNQPAADAEAMQVEESSLPPVEWTAAEQRVFGPSPNVAADLAPPTKSQEYVIQDFIKHGEAGERDAPDNAYFPWLLTGAYFANHQNDAAIASLIRASQDATYDDYFSDQLFAGLHVSELADGPLSAVRRLIATDSMVMDSWPLNARTR